MNNLIGQQYEVQIKNKLLESHENVFLWNEIPCQIIYDSNLFKSFKNKTKYFRKIQYMKKENHGIMDTGCDIFYQNNNEWIIVQCKNYENTICQDKLAGFYYLILVSDLNGELYYTSNLSNVIRIICNNMQTFLILLELTGKSATRQLSVDTKRLTIQKRSSDYTQKQESEYHTPFPNYYKEQPTNVSGKQLKRLSLIYPGSETINNNWFEVQFVEEIYEALKRIKESETPSTKGSFNQIKTGILSLFQLSESDLSVYNSKEYSKIFNFYGILWFIIQSYSKLIINNSG